MMYVCEYTRINPGDKVTLKIELQYH
eukprot:COSAG01_NODE_33214_length_568_cov_0.678038_2_plen_25_part_01